MHILLLPVTYPTSYSAGRGVFFREQAKALKDAGHQVGVLAVVHIFQDILRQFRFDFGFSSYDDEGITVFRYQFPSVPIFYWGYHVARTVIGKRMFRDYIRQHGRPDVIHVHGYLAGGLALWIKREYGIPYIVTEHWSVVKTNRLLPWQRRLAKKLFSQSGKNLAVSEDLRRRAEDNFKLPFDYLPNLVDTDFFSPAAEQKPPETNKKFLHVGNLVPVKNQLTLIQAFADAFPDTTDAPRLTIVGGGGLEQPLRREIISLSREKQIELTGRLSLEEVRNHMRTADVFVLSSRHETFGVVLIEAMACGVPVVATRCGGPESVVTDDKLGILCDISRHALATAMRQALEKTFDATYIRRHAVNEFSAPVITGKLTEIYRTALAAKQ